jgi:uncharacterized protein YcbK (DUF882 family)
MKVAAHFHQEEFDCPCAECAGTHAAISPRLIESLEELRAQLDSRLVITSGYRCPAHNARVGGAPPSKHLLGIAVDVLPPRGFSPDTLAATAKKIPLFANGGIGVYKKHVHLDVRHGGPVFWRG